MLDIIKYYANLISKEADINSLLITIANFGKAMATADRCSIWVVDSSTRELWTIVAQNTSDIRIPIGQGIVGYAIDIQEPLIVNDVYQNKLFLQDIDKKTGYKTECMMIIPINDTSGNQIGAIQALNKQDGSKYFSQEDLDYFKISASYIGDSLETLFLKQQLKDINKKLEKQIAEKTKELQTLNQKLQIKIDEEIQKSIEKDKLLINQSKQAQIGQMLSVIAHEWKQPLSSMYAKASTSIVELELTKFSIAKSTKNYQFISEKVDFLREIIDEFRHFFNPHKEMTTFGVKNMVNRVIYILEKDFLTSNIVIKKAIKDTVVHNYQNEIMHVILNILSNAKDAILDNNIKNGEIKISTYIKGNILKISILDNGGGIPKNIIHKIFEPYFSTKDETKGTGIGLHLSKMIIENKCKGKLYVTNTKNGAKFTIELLI